ADRAAFAGEHRRRVGNRSAVGKRGDTDRQPPGGRVGYGPDGRDSPGDDRHVVSARAPGRPDGHLGDLGAGRYAGDLQPGTGDDWSAWVAFSLVAVCRIYPAYHGCVWAAGGPPAGSGSRNFTR